MRDTVPGLRHTLAVVFIIALSPSPGTGQVDYCVGAERFLSDRLAMVTQTERDTLDDWRTGRRMEGCRVTAAGPRTGRLQQMAERVFASLRDEGWTRTPDPADAPNESSLRFRKDEVDCLFNVYQGILLGTPAEIAVTTEAAEKTGERVYNVVVICVPAVETP